MAMPSKTIEQCRELLAPGTTIEHVLPGTMVMSAGVGRAAMNVILAISPAEIIVFRVGMVSKYKPAQVWSRVSRNRGRITVEAVGSLLTCDIGELTVEIDDEYAPELHAAGVEVASS
ncbi:hypothetical protein [Amycolatopsis sp. 195334CR]|uniref:hypothetical protein n=1 Tax=Amycolatopsis sp. 195334CR TaxID=2814588 RepID=UPI001A8D85FE|nr:hypothetical protein [Amycolatopsis sp. 195334CR]MBN6038500.1 hypothetical protein [Amycolatopsis sp. 195334CR]